MARTRRTIRVPFPQRAFTLLEMIIAMALTSLMMVLVWSLFSTYTRLEERSSRTAVELQLMRSLSQQLRSDIDHFARLAIPTNVVPTDGDEVDANLESASESEDEGTGLETDVAPVSDDEPADEALADKALQNSLSVNFAATSRKAIDVFHANQTLTSSLPEQTYVRGSASKLEIVTRLPYTVDVPTGRQLLGAESRYGTHLVVVYEFRDARDLETLLRDDPVLNPSKFVPPGPMAATDPNQPPPGLPLPVAQPLNPNDRVGLIREAKSWLHVTRDRRRDEVAKQLEAAGQLANGEFPPPDSNLDAAQDQPLDRVQDRLEHDMPSETAWAPPPEFRHKIDQIPEVTRCQFRYHDGTSWQLDWNRERELPRAIEVAFDIDPDAPAARAKEFSEAHERMAAGAPLTDVLPVEEQLDVDEFKDQLDPMSTLNMQDPTAILTEYRFVISLARLPASEGESKEAIDSAANVDSTHVLEEQHE